MTEEKYVSAGLDEILKKLGPFGKYNLYNYGLLMLPALLSGLIGVAYNFEAMDINYRCEVPNCEKLNDTLWFEFAFPEEKGELSKCKVFQYITDNANVDVCTKEAFNTTAVVECQNYVYSEEGSVVKDFNLACQNWKRTLIGTIHNSGYFIALPLTGFISDRYGRTIALSIASLMNGIFGIARSFSTNYNMMLGFEFLESALGAGHYTSIFVMGMELARPSGRAFVSSLINSVHVVGILILSALAWWLQDWRRLLRVIFTMAFIPSTYFLFLKENPRWLISKGRYDVAATVLRNAAKMNKVELPEDMLLALINKSQELHKNDLYKDTCEKTNEQNKKSSLFFEVVKSKLIMTRLVICSYMWISGTLIYYGLSINSVSLAGNKYLNFMLVALVEIPANLVVILLIDKFGRKLIISITFLLSGCLCIGLSLLPKAFYGIRHQTSKQLPSASANDNCGLQRTRFRSGIRGLVSSLFDLSTLLLILYLLGKFFGTMAYSTVYVYVSEVFPTNVRQTLMSFCSTMGRIGTTAAPMTPLLALYYKNLPAIFFGCFALIASILTIFVPETLNVTLPNTIKEAEKMSIKVIATKEEKLDTNTN